MLDSVLPNKQPDLVFCCKDKSVPNIVIEAKYNIAKGIIIAMAQILSRGYLIPGCTN